MRKPTICIGENKATDQPDQHLCFRYTDSTIPLLLKSKISNFWPASVTVQPVLVCVGPGQNPNCWFSHPQAHIEHDCSHNMDPFPQMDA